MQAAEEGGSSEDQNARVEETPSEFEILNLRRRWELASVLNFLDVSYSDFIVLVSYFFRDIHRSCIF